VIIPVHNEVSYTKRCIQSLIEAGWRDEDDLVVMDNASTDGTQLFLQTLEGSVQVVRNETRRTTAHVLNQGAATARSEWLIFLAPDTVASAGWIEGMIAEAQGADADVVGARLTHADNSVAHAGIVLEQGAHPRYLARGAASDTSASRQSYEVQGVSGACMLVRAERFASVDGFHQELHDDCADLDLCLRVRASGGSVRYCGNVSLVHFEAFVGHAAEERLSGPALGGTSSWSGQLHADLVEGERIQDLAQPGVVWEPPAQSLQAGTATDHNSVQTLAPTPAPGGADPTEGVCVAGMHRSGTSMVTRLLNLTGLSLGPEGDLLPATEENPHGYWESRSLMVVNDFILQHFGGGWDLLPELPEGWHQDPQLAPQMRQARALLGAFGRQQAWGWKDPRNSVTLPFWQALLPGMATVLCLRNPLEVAASLTKRGSSSMAFSMNLWLGYNLAVMAATTPETRIVTHYDSYFTDPERELRRVCGRLGLEPSDEAVREACATTDLSLRHARATAAHLEVIKAPQDVREVYDTLCAEAGEVYAPALHSERATARMMAMRGAA